MAPLPSYGQGRDAAGPTFASLISGTNLTDVVITGKDSQKNITMICQNYIIIQERFDQSFRLSKFNFIYICANNLLTTVNLFTSKLLDGWLQ